jgi:hypothetical protein
VTLVIPMLEPARDGLTNTGRPRRSRVAASSTPGSADSAPERSRSTTWSPWGRPAAVSSFLVNSLSIDAALAKTPEPTYGMPLISSSPWIVPSSP